jgi:hypothetical protein
MVIRRGGCLWRGERQTKGDEAVTIDKSAIPLHYIKSRYNPTNHEDMAIDITGP